MLFFRCARARSDGGLANSLVPMAAMLTGTLLMLGIGVLLTVVLAIRKKRGRLSRNPCNDKSKHLGEFWEQFTLYIK